ncbi:MAG: tyrosine-type recombinase/integrase [Oscillospiraceae bacterium]|nr:tyrosine-type recombinase/integrase [Oscillospiraceae bacterium]
MEKNYFLIYLRKPRNSSIKIENRGSRISHSCASIFLNSGRSLKEVQEYLGHSTTATTANIYRSLKGVRKEKQNRI